MNVTTAVHAPVRRSNRSEEHTSELQSLTNIVCRLLLEKKTVRFFSVRAPYAQRANTASHVIKRTDLVIENATTLNICILNNSLGHPVGESCMTDPHSRS